MLARYDRMLLIPGTSSVAHLEENMAAAEIELDDADLAALDRVQQRDALSARMREPENHHHPVMTPHLDREEPTAQPRPYTGDGR